MDFMLVLGLVGKRASGKDIFAKYLRDRYKFQLLDHTKDVLAPILRKQGKPIVRENLTDLAMKLRKRYGDDILTKKLCKKIRGKQSMVISNIRFPAEAAYLHRAFKDRFKLITVEADPKLRYERAKRRGTKGEKKLSFREFIKLESLPTERIIPRTMELADFVIANNKTPRELYKKINNLIEKLEKNIYNRV